MANAEQAEKTLKRLLAGSPGFGGTSVVWDTQTEERAVQIYITTESAGKRFSAVLDGKFQGVRITYQYTDYGKAHKNTEPEKPPPGDTLNTLPIKWANRLVELGLAQADPELRDRMEEFAVELALKLI